MKPAASPTTNNSRRFFIATSNKATKKVPTDLSVCRNKIRKKLDVPKHGFSSPKRLFLGKVSVVKSSKSGNFVGGLADAEWQAASLDELFGPRQRDCAVTSARRDADWREEVRVGAFSPWRPAPVRHRDHIKHIKHTLVFGSFRERPLTCCQLPCIHDNSSFLSRRSTQLCSKSSFGLPRLV